MPVYTVQMPDGMKLDIEGPDGATNAQLFAAAKRHLQAQSQIANDQITRAAEAGPAADMSQVERFNAGMGKAFSNIGSSLEQLVGLGPSAQETQAMRARDLPLMRTGAGFAGNISGNVAAMSPLMLLPGAGTIAGAGAAGATMAGLSPTASPQERLRNMGIGFALGSGSQYAGTTGATLLGQRAARKAAETAARKSQNAIRDATLAEARNAGYVVPPSSVNKSFLNRRLESLAGKAAVGQQAAYQNQSVTNALARKEIGLPSDAAISEEALKAGRKISAQPYAEVAAVSPKAAADLEALKQARFDANVYSKHYYRSADPSSLKAAQKASSDANALELSIENEAANAGRPDLVDALRKARMEIAKNYSVDRALNVATGDVSANVLGRSLDKGVKLSGGLKTAGKFAEAFPPYAREGAKIPTPGVSKVEGLASLALGMGGYGLAGPVGTAAAALPLLSGPARSLVLSPFYQRLMATPSYDAGLLSSLSTRGLLPSPELAGMIARQSVPGLLSYKASK